jgi:hypothetical protein
LMWVSFETGSALHIFDVGIIWDRVSITYFVTNCWPLHCNAVRRSSKPVQPYDNRKDSINPSHNEDTQQSVADIHKSRTVCTKSMWMANAYVSA